MLNKPSDHIPLKLNLFDLKYILAPLKISENRIRKILYNKSKIVKEKKIQKKDKEEFRLLQYPIGEYKLVLKRLHKFFMRRAIFFESVCGGIINKNLFSMVKSHCGKEAIYQVDLKDFFPKIKIERIYSFFRSSGCTELISELLANLVSYEEKLPQGFPTSPIIANLIGWKMDYDHESICNNNNLKRTRWIDDILVSGRITDLQESIYNLETSIKKNGFIINEKKTKFVRRSDKTEDMIAVGLDLRKHKPDVPAKVYSKIEDILIAFNEFGIKESLEIFDEEFNSKDPQQSLKGKIRFIEEYNKTKGDYLRELYNQIDWRR